MATFGIFMAIFLCNIYNSKKLSNLFRRPLAGFLKNLVQKDFLLLIITLVSAMKKWVKSRMLSFTIKKVL
jgi:hypothetical protein